MDLLARIGILAAAVAVFLLAAAAIWVVIGWLLALVVTILVLAAVVALFNGPVRFDGQTGRFVRRRGAPGHRRDDRR